jgi:hypothetical protein
MSCDILTFQICSHLLPSVTNEKESTNQESDNLDLAADQSDGIWPKISGCDFNPNLPVSGNPLLTGTV